MSNIKQFESKKIRSHRDAEEGKWHFRPGGYDNPAPDNIKVYNPKK